MRRTTLYIADMDVSFIAQVRKALAGHPAISVVGSTGDGKRALEDIRQLSPDVLLTDMLLPGLDGIGLMNEARHGKRPPDVIVCTRFCSDAIMECACRFGASFFLCKPVDPNRVADIVVECRNAGASMPRTLAEESAENAGQLRLAANVRALLKRMGMPPRLSGYAYTLEAVLCCRRDRQLLRNLSSGVYAQLAQRMNTTVPRVERSLRSAIAVAYDRGALREHFSQRPSNRQFIEYILRETEAAEAVAECI